MTCAKCQKPLDTYFRIERVGKSGDNTVDVNVCSLVCLIGWAHDYAVTSGMKLAIAAQGAVRNAKDAARSLLKAIKGS